MNYVKKLAFLALLGFATVTFTQWTPVNNGAAAPVPGAQLTKLSIGSAQNIWSLWQDPLNENPDYRIVAQWNGSIWMAINSASIDVIADISATNEPNTVLILQKYNDASIKTLVDNQKGANDAQKQQAALTALKNKTAIVAQNVYVWNGKQLFQRDASNALANSIDGFNRNNIILNSSLPGIHGTFNNNQLKFIDAPANTLNAQAGSNSFYYLVALPAEQKVEIRSSDTIYYTLNSPDASSILHWNISNDSIWVVLDQAGTISILKTDKTTKKETSMPAIPSGLSYSGSQILFSSGFDDTAWGLGLDGVMYRFQ